MIGSLGVVGSDVTISRLGFGCARIYGGSESGNSARLLEAALSAGVSHFDTAPMYGSGQSEDVLGRVLAGAKDVTLTTKVGIGRPDTKAALQSATKIYRRFARPLLTRMPSAKSHLARIRSRLWKNEEMLAGPRRRLSASHIRLELEESLKRLKRNRVDLYLVHEPDQFDLDDEALETFQALTREGTVGAFGLAYGRAVRETVKFGTVLQSQYTDEMEVNADRTAIAHGVLRHRLDQSQSKPSTALSADDYLTTTFEENPNMAIIFSASSVAQIRELTASFQRAT
jgi:aryl-alcohol dehydrogenase-like predicted oxidoreductase